MKLAYPLCACVCVWLLGCAHGAPSVPVAAVPVPTAPVASASPETAAPVPELRVSELLDPGAELRPSAKALALAGQRVRLVGFVAELEEQPEGTLYLTAIPVHGDEAGGGTADLPPDAVLVSGAALAGKRVAHVSGPVEALGRLSVENREDARGRVSNFQLALEEPFPSADSRRAEHARRN